MAVKPYSAHGLRLKFAVAATRAKEYAALTAAEAAIRGQATPRMVAALDLLQKDLAASLAVIGLADLVEGSTGRTTTDPRLDGRDVQDDINARGDTNGRHHQRRDHRKASRKSP